MSLLDFSEIPQHLRDANSILIVLNERPSFDEQLAAASLLLVLKEQVETVLLVSPAKIENPTIAGLDETKTELGYKNLVVSFDYIPEAVNNVSYHINEESKKFYLTIQPESGHKPLDKSSVELDYAGAEADLVFLLGVSELEELGKLYHGYEDFYQNTTLAAFSKGKSSYAEYFVDYSSISSVCEAVFQMLHQLGFEIGTEPATNLLAGIQYETKNFIEPKADADTFEAVANLLRAGARRRAGAFSRAVAAKQDGRQTILSKQHQVVREEIEADHKSLTREERRFTSGKKAKPVKKGRAPKETKSKTNRESDQEVKNSPSSEEERESVVPEKQSQTKSRQQLSKKRGSSKGSIIDSRDSRDSKPMRPSGLRKQD